MSASKKSEDQKEFTKEIMDNKRTKEASLDLEKELLSLRNEVATAELDAEILISKQLKLKWAALILTAFIILFVVQTKNFSPSAPELTFTKPDLTVSGGQKPVPNKPTPAKPEVKKPAPVKKPDAKPIKPVIKAKNLGNAAITYLTDVDVALVDLTEALKVIAKPFF